ncbi:MAG TPA: bifunctional DNA primase/polymerase [Pseudonocardia sp.]|uniref:bifunctional DNA primase/polymerase n=1 Tax=Pseudonocardia sp. TaxID=60912 RepID=UPI002C7B2E08|nr:bifunctional DNA primase/polymerase [Pseudonocardia sp.]HTF49376.1 bifunctional DNA primase/polymerase [Pseudonocardia sp.]
MASHEFVSLFGGARENSDLVGIARAACREGYAVLAVKPLSKEPACTLTDRQRTTADRKAAAAAREAGVQHWERRQHPCGRNHTITDPVEADRVFKRLVATNPDLNIGLEVGASRLLVVDADTTAERESFTALWAQMEERPELVHAAPTVRSPGKRRGEDSEGNEVWSHKDGGHFWFLLPDEVDFAEACTSTPLKVGAHEAKASLMFRNQLVLVPPSVRAEGPYVMASEIQPAPAWMISMLHAHIAGHAERIDRHREHVAGGDDRIEDWSAVTTWDQILARYGWTTSGKTDQCGCEIWTRPGDWSSPKSATAHEPGCGLREVTGGVLHIWTDSPPAELSARKDWSKLQVIAAYDHAGDNRDAMTAVGILDEPAELRPLRSVDVRHDEPSNLTRSPGLNGSAPTPSPDEDEDGTEDEDAGPVEDEHTSWWPKDLDAVLSGENPEPAPCVLARTDGAALFYAGKVNGIIGPSESGKSWIALEAVAQELRARRPVLYLDFEDIAGTVIMRLRALGVPDELMYRSAQLLAYVGPEEALHAVAYDEYAQVLRARAWSLIVFDGVNAAMTQDGLDLISNTDATKFFTKITRPASLTGAAVVTIDHVPKDAEKRGKGGIGAQAKRATITGAAVYVDVNEPFGRGRSGSLSLTVDKDRPGFVRGEANATGTWAEVTVTAGEDGDVSVVFDVPAETTRTGTTSAAVEMLRTRIITYLKEIASEVSGTAVEKNVTGKGAALREQLAWLSENGYVGHRKDPSGRGGQLNSYLRDYPDGGLPSVSQAGDDDPFASVG